MATELHEEVKLILDNYDITVINNIEDFEKLITRVEENGGVKFKPNETVQDNVLIIFDNENYNSAFLHEHLDVFVKSIDEKTNIFSDDLTDEDFEIIKNSFNSTKIYYVNDAVISNTLMKDFYTEALHLPFDNNCLILFFNKDFDEVFIDAETFQQITAHNFFNAFSIIDNKEAINDMLTHIELAVEKAAEGSDSCDVNSEELK